MASAGFKMSAVVVGEAEVLLAINQFPPKMMRAASQGLQWGGGVLRTQMRQSMAQQTGAKIGAINRRMPSYATPVSYHIKGVGIPLKIPQDVPASTSKGKGAIRWSRRDHWKLQPRDGAGRFGQIQEVPPEVTGFPWRVAHLFKRSFVAKGGKLLAAIPKGSSSLGSTVSTAEFRRLFGPNVADELVKPPTISTFEKGVDTVVVPRIESKLWSVKL